MFISSFKADNQRPLHDPDSWTVTLAVGRISSRPLGIRIFILSNHFFFFFFAKGVIRHTRWNVSPMHFTSLAVKEPKSCGKEPFCPSCAMSADQISSLPVGPVGSRATLWRLWSLNSLQGQLGDGKKHLKSHSFFFFQSGRRAVSQPSIKEIPPRKNTKQSKGRTVN